MDIVQTVQQWGWTAKYDWNICHFRRGWESWNCSTWRSLMGYLTNVYMYLMWEQNLSLRLFFVGDQGKNNRQWMLPEIQNKHSNTLKQMKNLSYYENGHYTEAECPHRLWSFHSWRYPNSKWTQSWVTSPCGSELWGWTPCPSNSVSSHLARLWITDFLW